MAMHHIVAGTIIIMYDQVKKEIASRIADIQQNYQDVILSSSNITSIVTFVCTSRLWGHG